MREFDAGEGRFSSDTTTPFDKRQKYSDLLILFEIDPATVVDPSVIEDGHLACGIVTAGEMREICPECSHTHLKLVLRQDRVKHSHVYCECCNRCFDARYPDGSSALSMMW